MNLPPASTRRSLLRTAALSAPAIVGLNPLVSAQAANEGKLGVALCGLGGFSKQSIAPELPLAQNVYFAGAITSDAAKGREWATQYGFSEKNIFSYVEALQNGAVGVLSNGNYEFSWGYAAGLTGPNKDKVKKWLLDPKMAGGGAMFDTGVYPVQAACYLTGKVPSSVRAFPITRHRDLFPEGVEETMSFELLFDDGFQALCRASYSHNFHQCTTLGPKGSMEILAGDKGSVYGQSGAAKPNPKRLVIHKKEVPAGDTLQLAVLLDEFAKAITSKSAFKTDGAMGLRDIRIIEAIYASAKQGGIPVKVVA